MSLLLLYHAAEFSMIIPLTEISGVTGIIDSIGITGDDFVLTIWIILRVIEVVKRTDKMIIIQIK